ncbi:Valencene synthase [Camellia lanceoleosa]|uniref:Valencene synthase n=1 Tax=Camellia lanceoleosa TaxID=1840588 RepID=A0ACC0HIE5_9ERIC|nr:Valencene synthase [Camellia lanceoleosa]
MSTPILATIAQSHSPKQPEIIRKTACLHPSVWGDHFITYTPDDKITREKRKENKRMKELKEEVRKELIMASRTQLNLIDAIQRLGASYHFETEIEEALQHVYNTCDHDYDDDDDDLYRVSLQFRLLRQQSFDVPSGFNDRWLPVVG